MFELRTRKHMHATAAIRSISKYIKYLGDLIDQNLSLKYHIDSIVTKISKNVGLISHWQRHSVPRPILLNICKSLIHPYRLTYGLAAWGQACKTCLNKILVLKKRNNDKASAQAC